jgi:hypothetical protein
MIIYRVVQVALLGLLIFMAFNFQKLFTILGIPALFTRSVMASIAFQLVMIYPVWLLAKRDSDIEFEASLKGLSDEQLVALRKRRLAGDLWKLCIMGFFIVFVALAPDANKARALSGLLASVYFSFLLISLTYFQLFNYLSGKKQKEVS